MSLWKRILQKNITSWKSLSSLLALSEEQGSSVVQNPRFRFNIPRRLVQKMEKGRIDDPLLLQFLPRQDQVPKIPTFADPLQEKRYQKEAMLLHKYHGRALLLTTSACAMHCQYCFRQQYPYLTRQEALEEALCYIEKTQSLEEVILSGGDPLSLDERRLEPLLQRLDNCPHIQKIRFHTRFLIGIPERVCKELLTLLRQLHKQLIFVVHINHVREWDEEVAHALFSLQKLGIPILSQTVLLHGVNDEFAALRALFATLSNRGVLPYYLHQLDPIEGSSSLHVPIEKGKKLIAKLRSHLPGYAVPRYVQELPGEDAKTLLL